MTNNLKPKVYGLSFPTRKEDSAKKLVQNLFKNDSDDDANDELSTEIPEFMKKRDNSKSSSLSRSNAHRKTKSDLEKAMEQDPSVFQYDEIYDDICREKTQKADQLISGHRKESKYVGKLKKAADERKLERELCAERKAQKDIEEEADLYGDKEAFVTSAYKEKLIELRQLVSKRNMEAERESCMDVTKQEGLGGFYRYMFQRKTGDIPQEASGSKGSEHKTSPENLPVNKQTDQISNSHSRKLHRTGATQKPYHRNDPFDSSRSGKGFRDAPSTHSPIKPNCDKHKDSTESHELLSAKEHHAKSKTPEPNPSKSLSTPVSTSTVVPPAKPKTDPNFVYARPRITTDEELAQAKERYLSRKAIGIVPTIIHSDSE